MEKNNQTFNIKINLTGIMNAGKTSLLNREINDSFS